MTVDPAAPLSSSRAGLWWGLLGVSGFSFTVIFTRIAVGGLSPMFVGSARAVIAALLAATALALTSSACPPAPNGRGWPSSPVVSSSAFRC